MTNEKARTGRLVIVSNRLPFSVSFEDGTIRFHESTGGLVTGLSAYLNSLATNSSPPHEYLWVGWPGSSVDPPFRERLKAEALRSYRSSPVFLSHEEMESFYHGFCNKTLWPLFHYFPTYTAYREEYWQQYKRVNEIFCEALLGTIRADDIVWIHDYHLMLLPALLKSRAPHLPIGFFLHIPFPSFEVFRLLPVRWRREILDGMLGADLVGFHTSDYGQHFLQSVLRILGYEHNLGLITLPSGVIRVETFPMGIDFEKFSMAARTPSVRQEIAELRKSLPDSRVILSVDRLDYSKGIINRLLGYETLLASNPQFHGKVALAIILVPSRVMVEQYEMMKKQIEELIGKINGRFGSIGWTPVLYQYRYLPFEPLAAMYSISDIALVTPLRDGMNLVGKEYIATRWDQTGVLILSEMAGAAKELAEAIVINPNNSDEIADALRQALEMPPEEQKRRNQIMQSRLRRYDVLRWANDFVDQLAGMPRVQQKFLAKLLPDSIRHSLQNEYKRTNRRLLFLDYDGTLVPFYSRPELARPGKDLLNLLKRLADDKRNTIVLISGRDRDTLQKWFGELGIHLVAEHGVWIKETTGEWTLLKKQTGEWKSRILPILELYADRLPGSFVEEKEYAIAWHYRAADPDQSRLVVGEVMDHLVTFTANIDIQIMRGNKVIEVRTAGINKGSAGLQWLARNSYEFILSAGDDWTDEDLFAVLPESAYSIRVGITSTRARFNLRDSKEVIRLLDSLTKIADGRPTFFRFLWSIRRLLTLGSRMPDDQTMRESRPGGTFAPVK